MRFMAIADCLDLIFGRYWPKRSLRRLVANDSIQPIAVSPRQPQPRNATPRAVWPSKPQLSQLPHQASKL